MTLEELKKNLDRTQYVYDDTMLTVLYVALTLGRPLLIEGSAGVGKTEVAKVMAEALGRPLVRLQCYEGLDESKALYEWNYQKQLLAIQVNQGQEDRQALTKSLFSDEYLLERPLLQSIRSDVPVVLLIDEIDKLGSDYKGDPASALLEVFDTEQNGAFRDHFIELPFDLSDVLFITTANDKNTIPGPLLDRMEVIDLPGYTDLEKIQIARRHIIPKQLKKHGLKAQNFRLDDGALQMLIASYTRESGVRTMERLIAKLCRKTAKHMTETGKRSLHFTESNLPDYLGVPIFSPEKPLEQPECGVVNGLAWTSAGGEMLEVEAIAVDGTGKVELTGNLGAVMKESAQAAVTYLRSRARELNLPTDFYTKKDIHIHFPEGAVPKDGPSAGITTATAVFSALSGRKVPKNIAMTGEITLRGRVLPIGGLREKTMAAYRNHADTVIIPAENKKDLADIDPLVREHLSFILAEHMDQVLDAVFGLGTGAAQPAREEPVPAVIPPAGKSPAGHAIRQ